MSWIMPFPEKAITGEYGTMSEFRRKNNMQAHSGTDWAPAGSNKGKTPIPAIANGTIKLIQWSNVLGWVIVQSAMDKDRKVWYIGYCHLAGEKGDINCKAGAKSKLATTLKVGDKVKAGDTIGFVGNSGSASSGAHLHATLGKGVKDVFGPTSAKSDLKKAILANKGVAPKPKSEAPKPAPAPTAPKVEFYKAVEGDTLGKIALMYGTSIAKLVEDNNLPNADAIRVGQMIRIEK